MATASDDKDTTRDRHQSMEASIDAASDAIVGTAMEVAEFLNKLPQALIAAQRRELERRGMSAGPDDPRVMELEATIEQIDVVRATGQSGNARLQRAAAIAADQEDAFHGFVSDSELRPLVGVTVRLTPGPNTTTENDGYFRIPLGTKRPGRPRWSLAKAVASIDQKTTSPPPAQGEPVTANVEIVRDGKVLHRDPTPVVVNGGAVYREYLLGAPAGGWKRPTKS